MKKTVLVSAMGILIVGCGARDLGRWSDEPMARGAFQFRSLSVSPKEEDSLDKGSGYEIAARLEHTPGFATEVAVGYWGANDAIYSDSTNTAVATRVTLLYTARRSPGVSFSVGGGLTYGQLDYSIGQSEQIAADSFGLESVSLDVDAGLGYHVQADVALLARNGVTLGFFVRYTSLELDATGKGSSGGVPLSVPVEVDLSTTDIGLTLGVQF